MKLLLLNMFVFLLSLSIVAGYQWNPNKEDYQWRPCSTYEATKKNCPRGEPCLADTSYRGYVPNYALKCLHTKDFVNINQGSSILNV